MGGGGRNPTTIKEIFSDFKGRRAGILKALTIDVEEFYWQCDPKKENLCLYGFPNEKWEVNLPSEEVPPEIPEPVLGINFARDGMKEKDWLALVAVHSDSWLHALASFFSSKFGLQKNDRKRLLNMMVELPTVFEVVTEAAKKQKVKKKYSISKHNSNKSKTTSKVRVPETQAKYSRMSSEEDEEDLEEDSEDEDRSTLCGACGEHGEDEFWICCDKCEKWFHGKCMKITPARAEYIKQYKCPACSNKRAISRVSDTQVKFSKAMSPIEDEEGLEEEDENVDGRTLCGEDENVDGRTLCGACGEKPDLDLREFWICCDICETWFHGKCMEITPARAKHIKQFKCPACTNKRARH